MQFVTDAAGVERVADGLRGATQLAVDTEAAGYHRYHDRICLLQISDRINTYLIDTLAISELGGVAPLLADAGVETVFHDADYDLRLLARDFGVRVHNLFDTKLAAQLLGEPAIGLAALLEKYLGVQLDKKHQRADWAQRPLGPDLLEYAAQDTRHLLRLRDRLREELEAKGRLEWAEEEFEIRENQVLAAPTSDPDAYLKLKNTRDLLPRQLAALRELYGWRERVAQRRDVAPFRVAGNDVLVAVARSLPRNFGELVATPGVPRTIADRHGRDLLQQTAVALGLPEEELPRRKRGGPRPPLDPEFDRLVERLKGARDAAAEELGLDRGFLMPRQQLEDVARSGARLPEDLATVPDMRRWQISALGERLIRVLTSG